MEDSQHGQLSGNAAEVYEQFFVPALFARWADTVADTCRPVPGARVLDVACGTGVLARTLKARVGDKGRVCGVDRNPAMLAVARRHADIEYVEAMAESLPYEVDSFDVVASQFGLMFFEEPVQALREMVRVLRPGGRMVVAVWGTIEETPGYCAMATLLEREFGAEVADAVRKPYALGQPADLLSYCAQAGLSEVRLETLAGTVEFPSIDAWVHTEIRGWTLAGSFSEAAYAALLELARKELAEYTTEQGQVRFASQVHVVTLDNPDMRS